MTRRLNLWLLGLLIVIGLPFYWLLLDNQPGTAPAKPVHIARLRQLAASLPGPAPTAVEMELTAYGRLPGTLFAAGIGVKRQLIAVMAFRLPVAGSGPMVIDSGVTRSGADELGMELFDEAASRRVAAALRSASSIVLTHEHFDHLGGVLALGDAKVLDKVCFNPAQLPGHPLVDQMPWPAGYRPLAAISGTHPRAIAPGVVVIPAPSHTPGSQMIYVQLASGREYLFAGDIATLSHNWRELRAASRLMGEIVGAEDRSEIYAWLRTIRRLKTEAPRLEVIAGHDYYWISQNPGKRGIVRGFRQ